MTNYIDEIWYDENKILNATVKHFVWKGMYYKGRLRNEIKKSLENYKENLVVIYD